MGNYNPNDTLGGALTALTLVLTVLLAIAAATYVARRVRVHWRLAAAKARAAEAREAAGAAAEVAALVRLDAETAVRAAA